MEKIDQYFTLLGQLKSQNYQRFCVYIVDSLGSELDTIIDGWLEESLIEDIPRLKEELKKEK